MLGIKNPFSILCSLRSREEYRHIMFGDISLEPNGLDIEYLKFNERMSKTRNGALWDDIREMRSKIWCSCQTSGRDPCVVEIFKEFVARRPVDYRKDSDSFYVQI